MIIADVTADPSDFIGPTISVANPNTISVEEWSAALAGWLLARGLDVEPGPRIVVRRLRYIHAVLPDYGDDLDVLRHIASRVASTWHAAYSGPPEGVEVVHVGIRGA